MDTPIDMYDNQGGDVSRKEKGHTLMSRIHTIPKKVADTAQTQGVSEKFLSQGLMSGFIHPSVLAHDRYLSIMDGIQDAIIISALLFFIPMFGINWFTILVYVVVVGYWAFHVSWWEKTQAWKIKNSVIKYVNNTYRAYWVAFLVFMVPASAFLWYAVFTLGIEAGAFKVVDFILMIIAKSEAAIADVFHNVAFINSNFSKHASYSVSINTMEYETRFMLVGGLFVGITILAKLFFGRMYRNERNFHANESEKELDYAGESALRAIREVQNAS